jgi:hypothetical protein
MAEVLSLMEMKMRYKSEWILVEDPETIESLELKRGKVLWHSKDRDEVYRKAREFCPKHSAILYTGTLPDGMAVVL